MIVFGIDVGGSKTVGLLADEQGQVIGEALVAGANLQGDGELHVEKILHEVMARAIGQRSLSPDVICVGMAGSDRENDARVVKGILRRLAFTAKALVTNDALIALVAGAGHAPGVLLSVGTGSIAYGRKDGRAARAGGWGPLLSDEGSAYWFGRLALRAVMRQGDGRGPQTRLTPLILAHFGVTTPQELIRIVYGPDVRPAMIAALANHVEQARLEADAVAIDILEQGAGELVQSAASVVRQLDLADESFIFVLSGGAFDSVPWLESELVRRLPTLAPGATVRRLDRSAAYGAVTLALDAARGTLTLPAYQ